MHALKLADLMLFLSTLSLRRATHPKMSDHPHNTNFYPRSPCGERLWADTDYNLSDIISIHALLAESDRNANCNCRNARPISIHALLAESDQRT